MTTESATKDIPGLVESSWKRVSVGLAKAVGTVIGLQNLLRSKIRKLNSDPDVSAPRLCDGD